jgi:hypothetical protein
VKFIFKTLAVSMFIASASLEASALRAITCDDVEAALASSNKFSEWRGKKKADGEWTTTHPIFGFTECVVVNQDFRCTRQSSGYLPLAQTDYTAFRRLIEACLPRPEWKHNAKADPLPSQGFVHPDGRNGFIALRKIQERKPGTFEPMDTYWLQITIFEHF